MPMDPALSHRAGRAFQRPPITDLEPPDRAALRGRLEAAGTWENLRPADRAVILEAEGNLEAVLAP